ncbi:MAG: long-chain fatty acid--CoA ligase [Gammaproteobacteria bacterium]|nr:long-chain fatty acid--CoA ligase [Gammaproteobacteria bacterium]
MNDTTQTTARTLTDTYADGWPATLAQGFLHTVAQFPSIVASRTAGNTDTKTWAQIYTEVEQLASSLYSLGVRRGDTVAILLKNRPEFLVADLAAMCLGAAPFSLYSTLPTSQIIPQLENADARIIICEQSFLPQILEAQQAYPELEHIILLEGGGDANTIDWSSLFVDVGDFDLKAQVEQIQTHDLGTIIYTSGTTGAAKGVELTHGGLVELVRTNNLFLNLFSGERFFCWLPLAGMAERISSYYQGLMSGGTIIFCDDTQKVISLLPDVRPHLFFSPPRLWEKIKDVMEQRWIALPEAEQAQIHHAIARNLERVELEQSGKTVPEALARECAEYDDRWFKPLRDSMGFGAENIYVTSGGAAASPELLKFYYAIGLPLDECYGQTESCGLGTRNPRNAMKIGTVGKPQVGLEFKFAPDNEILLRSPALMHQYRKQPDKTAEAKDADGWLHTGDIGEMDADGYLKIVDRKKDMIINSFGKNMSPVNIEAAITDAGAFIAQAVCIGDARRYNTAVLTLNSEYALNWAKQHHIPHLDDFNALINDPRLNAEVEAEVIRGNESLSRVEQIKKFVIVGKEWVPGDDELTPTMKIKRKVIAEKYAAKIESMYA